MHFACGRVSESSTNRTNHWGPEGGLWPPASKMEPHDSYLFVSIV